MSTKNAWASKNAEIAALKREIVEFREMESIKPFVEDFLQQLGTVLAYTPMDKWPNEAKAAFEAAQRNAPTAAWLYKERNKKHALKV